VNAEASLCKKPEIEQSCRNFCFLRGLPLLECFKNQSTFFNTDNGTKQCDCNLFLSKVYSEPTISFMPVGGIANPTDLIPISDFERYDMTLSVLNLVLGTYAKVGLKIELAYESTDPNIYLFENFNLVVHGGLVRNLNLEFDGITMAIAASVAAYIPTTPKHPDAEWATCANIADYHAGDVMRIIWYSSKALDRIQKGSDELKKFFNAISYSPPYAVKDCYQSENECRYKIYMANLQYAKMPDCTNKI